ncbi:MAG: cation transporter [Proteobacteria bacterium]|nr:cation transporter [Pseudomonadota bacterium]
MGASCCEGKNPELEKMARDQRKVLWIVLAINIIMFGVEAIAGIYADSVALLGDSLDMLGDALAYGVTLYVVGLGLIAKARSAMFKGWIILFSSVSVIAAATYRVFTHELPSYDVMGIIGVVALIANLTCLVLLTRFRNTDVNMASVWLCSRNDIVANVSVLCAAVLVSFTGSPWPDLAVGGALAIFFARSAFHIFSESRRSLDSESVGRTKVGSCP